VLFRSPDRGLLARVRRGEARVAGDGRAHLCRIHVVDLIAAIRAAEARQVDGVINCADDEPTPAGEVADTAAAALGLPPPPRIDPS
jgi:nucleoside-diphosphate-sugar epimerase